MLFNTFSPSVHTASRLPRGLFSFLHNIKLPQLNNNYGKTEEYTYFICFFGGQRAGGTLAGTKFSKTEIASITFIVLHYSTHSAAPWWPTVAPLSSITTTTSPPPPPPPCITVMSLSYHYLSVCGEKGGGPDRSPNRSDARGPAVIPTPGPC